MNNFDSDILCTIDRAESGSTVNLLDLVLRFVGRSVLFETYRKPLCSYAYTPADSCHPKATFGGIIRTELHRILLTNALESSFMYHVEFFVGKLVKCGYGLNNIRSIVKQIQWSQRLRILSRKERRVRPIIPFKIAYSSGADALYITSAFMKHRSILGSCISDDTQFLTAFRSNPNIFRLRFRNKYLTS